MADVPQSSLVCSLDDAPSAVGAPTLLKTAMVLQARLGVRAVRPICEGSS